MHWLWLLANAHLNRVRDRMQVWTFSQPPTHHIPLHATSMCNKLVERIKCTFAYIQLTLAGYVKCVLGSLPFM